MGELSTAKDFATDQEVRWCPGCGDYAILKAMRATLAKLGRPKHHTVFVSGIGCAARFPYYMDTFGFHTIHGRAPAVATGLKLANPDLDIWVVGGDGDLLAIGGNHLVHTLRRNIDLNILLFNNAIYGLTKGQASPTSAPGTVTPTSPTGSQERPTNSALLALASGATFVARAIDTDVAHLSSVLEQAHRHRGTALVEIHQNCIVFNDGVWGQLSSKGTRKDRTVELNQGHPLLFGSNRDMGLKWHAVKSEFEVVRGGDDPVNAGIAVFDERNFIQSAALARMSGDDLPVALGVVHRSASDDGSASPQSAVPKRLDLRSLQSLLDGSDEAPKQARRNG